MILNKQKKFRLALRPLERFLYAVQQTLKLKGEVAAIAFVTDAEMARRNEMSRKKKGPTDVLSFPAERKKRTAAKPAFLGDIAIAPETARRYAKKNGRTLESELRILILHGILHLLGYDHETDQGEMDRIERKLRRKLGLER